MDISDTEYIHGLVSVVIPTYNRATVLQRSVRSVMEQSYKNLEIIVVDDGSSDDTPSVIDSFAGEDDRIRCFVNDGVKGAAGARNSGIEKAQGEFVAFQDSDTVFYTDKIGKQIRALEADDRALFSYSRFKKAQADGTVLMVPGVQFSKEELDGDILKQILVANVVDCPTMVVRHEALDETGYFDTEFQALEDYDLVIRLAKAGEAAFVDEVLLDSFEVDRGVSSDEGKRLSAMCRLLLKYKQDYIETGTLNAFMQRILTDAADAGVLTEISGIMEKIIQLG